MALIHSIFGLPVMDPVVNRPTDSFYVDSLHMGPLDSGILPRNVRAISNYQEVVLRQVNDDGLSVALATYCYLESVYRFSLSKPLTWRVCHENFQLVGSCVIRNLR